MYDFVKVNKRKDFGDLLKCLGLNGVGVEVGVYAGEFSETLLQTSNLHLLISVDPWISVRDQKTFDERYKETVERLAPFGSRSLILKESSVKAAASITNESLDFVYIDADHTYSEVSADIEAWWVKLKVGGLLAGHDYAQPKPKWGVIRAVDEHVKKNNLNLYLTRETDIKPSWYFVKDNR